MCKGGKYKYGNSKYEWTGTVAYYSTYSVLYRLVGRLGFSSKG